MGAKWQVDGTYFETCNCDAACPCIFLSDPTEDECTVLLGWHITQGHYGDVDLQGLNAVMAVYSPGNMIEHPWRAGLYVDGKASAAQQEALTMIFSGQAGGHPSRLASHVGEFLGVKSVEIVYRGEGKKRSLSIPGIAEAEIEAIEGQGGEDATISGHPFAVAPGFPVVQAKSTRVTYTDHDLNWEISQKNGFYSPFTYSG